MRFVCGRFVCGPRTSFWHYFRIRPRTKHRNETENCIPYRYKGRKKRKKPKNSSFSRAIRSGLRLFLVRRRHKKPRDTATKFCSPFSIFHTVLCLFHRFFVVVSRSFRIWPRKRPHFQLVSNVWIRFFLGKNRVMLVIRTNFAGTVFLEMTTCRCDRSLYRNRLQGVLIFG